MPIPLCKAHLTPGEARALSQLATDILLLLESGQPSAEALSKGLPMLDRWCETLTPQKAIIGLSGLENPASIIVTPIIAKTDGWVRSLNGWYRLGRHIDGAR